MKPDNPSTVRTPLIEEMLKTSSQKLLIAFVACLLCFLFVLRPKCSVVYLENSQNAEKCLQEKLPKVTVDVFYESLCPDTKGFFDRQVKSTHDALGSWITWRFVPFGKADIAVRKNLTILTCQHGPRECTGNKYHACMIHSTTNATLTVNALSCMFELFFGEVERAAQNCCRRYGLDFRKIQACAIGTEGTALISEHKKSTDRIRLRFVPTIVLNKVQGPDAFQGKILKSLKTEVCNILRYDGVKNVDVDSVCTGDPNTIVV